MSNQKLRVISLGGLQEFGKNMVVYEYGDDIIVVDCGLAFPDDDLLGVDIIIADTAYLKEHSDKIKALFITHAHEDHIGAIPYFLKDFDVPIYASKFALGIIDAKLRGEKQDLIEMKVGSTVDVGAFSIEALRVNHSTPDSFAFAIRTPVGLVIQTGDFKIDHSPIDDEKFQFSRFAELGDEGVLLLLSDSTNAIKEGYSMSESSVGENLDELFSHELNGRIIVACFASNVHRIQQVINSARLHGRKVALVGKGMVNTTNVALSLGYLHAPDDIFINMSDIDKYEDRNIVILSTGTQGEPMSALTRIAHNEHRNIFIKKGDLVIFSSSAIPGNEKPVYNVINLLMRMGAKVIFESWEEVHVSGHAKKEELKTMIGLVRPKYLIPVHGEYLHMDRHRDIAVSTGMDREHVLVLENGDVVEFTQEGMEIGNPVDAGKVFIDAMGSSDIDSSVIRERKRLSEDGLIVVTLGLSSETGKVVTNPQITTRGFLFPNGSDDGADMLRTKIEEEFMRYEPKSSKDAHYIRIRIKDALQKLMYRKYRKNPVVIVLTVEVDEEQGDHE